MKLVQRWGFVAKAGFIRGRIERPCRIPAGVMVLWLADRTRHHIRSAFESRPGRQPSRNILGHCADSQVSRKIIQPSELDNWYRFLSSVRLQGRRAASLPAGATGLTCRGPWRSVLHSWFLPVIIYQIASNVALSKVCLCKRRHKDLQQINILASGYRLPELSVLPQA